MASETAFLHDITEHIDDDAPRLVFADWCDDNADPARGEFVRLQCRLAKMSEYDPERPALVEREQQLLSEHRRKWTAAMPTWAQRLAYSFRRGFVGQIEMPANRFLDSGENLWRAAAVEALTLEEMDAKQVVEVARSPLLGSVRELSTGSGRNGVRWMRAILNAPHMQLRKLTLWNTHFNSARLGVLASWSGLARLTDLHIGKNGLGDGGLQTLLASPHLPKLESLDLSGSNLTAQGARDLWACARLHRLRNLILQNNAILDQGASALACALWPQLEALNLSSSGIGAEGVRALVGSASLANLRSLELTGSANAEVGQAIASGRLERLCRLMLNGCRLETEGVGALVSSGVLSNLVTLDLDNNGVSEAAILALAGSTGLGRLTHVNLGNAQATIASLDALFSSPHLPGLSEILLYGSLRDPATIAELAKLPSLLRISRINLAGCSVGTEGIKALAASPYAANLTSLSLGSDDIDDADAAAIASSPYLTKLVELNLHYNNIGAVGARALAESANLAGLRILRLEANPRVGGKGAKALAQSPYLDRLMHLEVHGCGIGQSEMKQLADRFGHAAIIG